MHRDGSQGNLAQGRWVLVSAILGSGMAFIDGSAVGVALPAIQADLEATGAQLLWIVNGFLLVLAALMLQGGALGDRLGRRRVFMAGIVLFSLSSLVCGLSPSANFLIAARLLQGAGGAVMVPGSLAIITAYFGPGNRGRAIGTWSAATTVIVTIGPLLGGALAGAGLWRGVFLLNLPIAVVALAILVSKVPESSDSEARQPDWIGSALIAPGLAGLAYGFITAPAAGFSDPRIYGSLLAGAGLLAAFIIYEWRSSHPMLPLFLFRSRTFSGANLLTLFLYGALNVSFLFLPLNLVQVQGYSSALAGAAFLPFTFILAGLSRWAGGLTDRVGPRLPLIAGPALAGIGFVLLGQVGLTEGPASFWWTFFPGMVVFGLGMGITVAPLTATVMGAWPRYAGTESGVNNAVARIAGVLTIAVLGSLALISFSTRLDAGTQDLDLSPGMREEIRQQSARLGEAEVPAGLPEPEAASVGLAIRQSFADTYRLIMFICAVMAWLSAGMSALLLSGKSARYVLADEGRHKGTGGS